MLITTSGAALAEVVAVLADDVDEIVAFDAVAGELISITISAEFVFEAALLVTGFRVKRVLKVLCS